MSYVGQQSGFTVTEGDATQFTQAGGCTPTITTLGSCFGNNPITPYIIDQVPVGSATLPAWTSSQSAFGGTSPTGAAVNNFYQLSMNEALVTVITLPPTGAYWSFQTYMIERNAQYYPVTPTNCPGKFQIGSVTNYVSTPDCGYDVFGMFNNTINNAVVFNQFGQGFSDPSLANPVAIAIITTPNQNLYNALQQDFYEPQNHSPFGSISEIFPEVMPTSGAAGLNVGLQQTSDLFGSIIRYNVPENQSAGDTWLANPGTYINVYRVYSSSTPTAFPTPTLTAQSANTDECDLPAGSSICAVTRYQADLAELSNVLVTYLNKLGGDSYTTATASHTGTNTVNCIVNGFFCQGATNDNDSYRSYPLGLLPVGSYAIIVGVLHSTSAADTATPPGPINNSVYTSITWADTTEDAIGISENEGVSGGASQNNVSATGFTLPQSYSKYLTGSAEALLKALAGYGNASLQLKTDLPDLYAVVLSRSVNFCGIPLCNNNNYYVNIIAQGEPPNGIPSLDLMSITERAYLLPGTPDPLLPPVATVGASAPYLLGPTIIYDQTANP